jgi:hypothetical protein
VVTARLTLELPEHYISLKNIYCVGNTFIASATVQVFETERKCLAVCVQCFHSYQLASSSLYQLACNLVTIIKLSTFCNQTNPAGSTVKESRQQQPTIASMRAQTGLSKGKWSCSTFFVHEFRHGSYRQRTVINFSLQISYYPSQLTQGTNMDVLANRNIQMPSVTCIPDISSCRLFQWISYHNWMNDTWADQHHGAKSFLRS